MKRFVLTSAGAAGRHHTQITRGTAIICKWLIWKPARSE